MNLFACEENVFKWSQTDPNSGDGIRSVEDWAAVFSIDLFRRRLDPDYLSKMQSYRAEMRVILEQREMTGPWFFRPQ